MDEGTRLQCIEGMKWDKVNLEKIRLSLSSPQDIGRLESVLYHLDRYVQILTDEH